MVLEPKECMATPLLKLPGTLIFKGCVNVRYVSIGLDVRGFWFLRCYDYERDRVGTLTYDLDGDDFDMGEILGYGVSV